LLTESDDYVNSFRMLTMNCASWAAYGHPGTNAQDEVYHISPGNHPVE
jgi:hypothetical protein